MPVMLGSAATYGILGAATVTSSGDTQITGDLGVSPGTAVTGSPNVSGTIHAGDSAAARAQVDLSIAYIDAAGRTNGLVVVAGDLGGQTLGPGLYGSASSLSISSGDLTLSGDANAVWIFQMGSTLVTTTGRRVIFSGGGQAANVFWQVGSSATIGANSVFKGSILAAQSITLVSGASLDGRALAQDGQVSLDGNNVTVPQLQNEPGSVIAWGDNTYGQTMAPGGLGGLTAIAAGESHNVALRSDGTVAAWGDNSDGQTTVPAGLQGVTAIAAGQNHTVVLKSDGTLAAWGDNSSGQTTIPVGLGTVTAVAAGFLHTVVLQRDGTVVAWGDDTYGQSTVPAGLSGVIAITAGDGHTVALKSNGAVVAWGANGFFHQTTLPPGLAGVTAIAAGENHTLALLSDGTVVGWGSDLFGQTSIPAHLTGVTALAAGRDHSVALKDDGTVVAWGWNDNGQTVVPAKLGGVTAIAAGWYHTVALLGPIIIAQPAAQTFALGGAVTLNADALGSGLTYQWQFNGRDLVGATSSALQLTSLSAADAGAYDVIVTSAAGGAATSQIAVLTQLFFGNLNFYAGMTLEGTVGRRFRVDYSDTVTGGSTNWQSLTNLTLPSSPYLVIDPGSPGHPTRFYRAVPLL